MVDRFTPWSQNGMVRHKDGEYVLHRDAMALDRSHHEFVALEERIEDLKEQLETVKTENAKLSDPNLRILEAEKEDPCPFGLVRVSKEELELASESLRKRSGYLIGENGAESLAFTVLTAIRSAHFSWHRENSR